MVLKYLIASDIHGSALYCRKLLDAWEKEQADRVLLLGDILYHGPRNDLPEEYSPRDVIAMLNPLRQDILCVRGNCDTEVDQMVLDFPILADYAYVCDGGVSLFLTHGHIYHAGHLPPLRKKDILLHGHTHVPAWENHRDFLYLNPGSVSIPKEDSPHSYMVLEDGTFLWKDLDGRVYHSLSAGQAFAT